MFPPLRVTFSGLDHGALYDVLLDVIVVDSRRYRYAYHRSSWVVADRCSTDAVGAAGSDHRGSPEAESTATARMTYRHPDSPLTGRQLTQRTVSFDRVKLTNNTAVDKNAYVCVLNLFSICCFVCLILKLKRIENDADICYCTFVLKQVVFQTFTISAAYKLFGS